MFQVAHTEMSPLSSHVASFLTKLPTKMRTQRPLLKTNKQAAAPQRTCAPVHKNKESTLRGIFKWDETTVRINSEDTNCQTWSEVYLVVQVYQELRGLHPHQVWCKAARGLVAVTWRSAVTFYILQQQTQRHTTDYLHPVWNKSCLQTWPTYTYKHLYGSMSKLVFVFKFSSKNEP